MQSNQASTHTLEIDTLDDLKDFANFLKTFESSEGLAEIEILNLEHLTYILPDFQKNKAIELIDYILKNDPYIDELLMVNNPVSKDILQALAKLREQ